MNESQSFTMHSTFPKRDYTEADMSQTLRDLQLAPSATLLIIPVRSKAAKAFSNLIPVTSNSSSSGSNASSSNSLVSYANDFMGFLFLPFTIIWGLVSGLFGIGSSGSNASSSSSNSLSRHQSQNQPPVSESIRIRNMRRNFGTLNDNRDGRNDDENATWNGNSTQQY